MRNFVNSLLDRTKQNEIKNKDNPQHEKIENSKK